ncbi:MAG: orotidine-5'-phosphate decarboxylase [Coriobacteriia bacterium]|nr:orotidine-5'-phosphate decarboxylase [Coriobacteriia bacterium]
MEDISDRLKRVVVALDLDYDEAMRVARQLQGHASWMKVGMTLFYAEGPAIVSKLKDLGFKVFIDLKLFDIPHQVSGAAASLAALGADLITVHAIGGQSMLKAAVAGASEGAIYANVTAPKLLGITVVTSMSQDDLADIGVSRDLDEQVSELAALAMKAGLNGVVASPQELVRLRGELGNEALVVTPGIRPAGSDSNDQTRTATPAEAFDDGASYIVIGRPITAAADPLAAFNALFD